MSIQVLNNSPLTTFRQCPHKWGLRYVQKLVPKFMPIDARYWGHLYHRGQEGIWPYRRRLGPRIEMAQRLQAAHQNVKDMADEKLHDLQLLDGEYDVEESIEDLDRAVEEVEWAIKNYTYHNKREIEEWVVLGTELTLRTIVSRGVHHQVTIDLLAYDPMHDRLVIVDHKSTSSPVNVYDGRLQLDTQHVGYTFVVRDLLARALRKKGPFIGIPYEELQAIGISENTSDCFQWHVVRSKVPTIPSINKLTKKAAGLPFQMEMLKEQEQTGENMGEVSVRAIDTLPQIYEEALLEQAEIRGLPITEKQQELLNQLKRKGDSFFGLTETFVPEDRINRWKAEFLIDAKRIRQAYRLPVMRTRNPSSCSLPMSPRCEYKDICIEPSATTGYVMDPDIVDTMEERDGRG